ncbi:MAG: hypothetical protein COW44_09030 [Flavobacteriaceae bacterium CG17_big_fil_post_rev_8_21_14_2_50_33_15]|nr:MAG: hypothetical protein COW44_09030 [Flavobacteriaceae bacterium CG17_big_fil_post_rev_8_21_14_2_50_33_15]
MIKYLRKIRHKLLDEGNLKRYLIYATGEILLVMIGILLALQINNWNEWRKDRVKEKVILNDLAKNIEFNIQTFEDDIKSLQHWNYSSSIVISALKNKHVYSDSMRKHLHLARVTKQDLFLSSIGYQAYKDKGLDIITNKSLSKEIINLYEVTVPKNLSTNKLVNESYPEFDNHVVQNFEFIQANSNEGDLTPHDYKSLFSDHFYISWIKAYGQGRLYLIKTDKALIEECKRVLKLINTELNIKYPNG